jgi:hypothetical protein
MMVLFDGIRTACLLCLYVCQLEVFLIGIERFLQQNTLSRDKQFVCTRAQS